jgi:2-polyprenyl-6-hydroxyphenyl methylase/3-demethylubiquinone-9 3-methyltransferase
MGDKTQRTIDDREYCHERLGEVFSESLCRYDVERRLKVLLDDFLGGTVLRDKNALDVGCGLGFFSEGLNSRGARVVACDIGPTLVERTRQRVRCEAIVADALQLIDCFGRDRFDVVVSSECIEHTPDPAGAIAQMVGVTKPGGWLAISTPNIVWKPAVYLASRLRLRPYDGFENFSSWRSVRRSFRENGARVVRELGCHLFPFQLPLNGLSSWCDAHLQFLRFAMINMCVLAQKGFGPQQDLDACLGSP